jgi:hypothetical protein
MRSQGSPLIGTYESQVAFGQSRVLLVWTRIMPNGRSIVLERQQVADSGGYSGLEDEVDNVHLGLAIRDGKTLYVVCERFRKGSGADPLGPPPCAGGLARRASSVTGSRESSREQLTPRRGIRGSGLPLKLAELHIAPPYSCSGGA